ncbi:hypothetical protein [Bacteroides sp. UBA939]|uniref:hypothetical protein n=1 Tax=Bacteroides sp. UBA939 TaxID=1946092 RepID=UPI0025BFEE33|nr:hypothetical protein [Bacteroides sp. UBA939]
MAAKLYKPQDSEASQVNEPMAVYQRTAAEINSCALSETELNIILRSKEEYKQGEYYTQKEVDKMIEQWLS